MQSNSHNYHSVLSAGDKHHQTANKKTPANHQQSQLLQAGSSPSSFHQQKTQQVDALFLIFKTNFMESLPLHVFLDKKLPSLYFFKLYECKFAQNRRKETKSFKTKKVQSKSRSETSLVCKMFIVVCCYFK